ncbi:TIGR01244 family sulfur transferase [Marinobacter sp. TBZ242]|uniref:TIGR01244 family sulfur transferase n=1 Tax=Marinobacter azerbaijanicus TaxID=3050455 RepID=A0ABT7IHW0_9GAMM|nr:TIGR01244 family sulfur transferase [Marinobacter sp. TBZ242]MDL0433741.1 TIGR01244 family sulfur transferase [Marinobacter sp. TBZ242]
MDIKPLDNRLYVTAQPRFDELEQLAEQGFRTIVSNRPRGESDDQPDFDAMKTKAESLGMAWHEIPVKPGEYAQADIDAFADVLHTSKAPVLGFCRTGKRVSHLWALSLAPRRPVSELIASANAAGYDLEPLRGRLEQQAKQSKGDSAS